MALAVTYAGTAIDLTDPAVNVDVAPVATPRQGGFTLRNRFEGSLAVTLSGSAASGSSLDNNIIYVLEVPPHTLVERINLFAVEGKTVPGHACAYSGTPSAESANDHQFDLTFMAQPVKKWATSNGTKTRTYDSLSAALMLGEILLTSAGNSAAEGGFTGSPLAALEAPGSSTSSAQDTGFWCGNGQGASNATDDGTFDRPYMFPHGGRIVMAVKGAVASSATALDLYSGVGTGTWEIQAECQRATNGPIEG
jgi:hypothetical protein